MSNIFKFDEFIDRRNTDSYKWSNGFGFGEEEIIPMWISDMDFACPKPIVDAVMNRARNPIYGYAKRSEEYIDCISNWLSHRFVFKPPREWMVFAPPGVLFAIALMLRIVTQKGDKVMVMMPNYPPLHSVVTLSERKLVEFELELKNNEVEIDFDDFAQKISDGIKLLIISSPHNPTGRVWRKDELKRIAELCLKHNVYIISDEIHADFVARKYDHTPLSSLGQEIARISMSCYSVNKGFNLGGLQTATIIIADKRKRDALSMELNAMQTRLDGIFGIAATQAAYSDPDCEIWLDAAISYVENNKQFVYSFLKKYNLPVYPVISEGTYLMWLDCRGMNMSHKNLERFFIEDARVQFSMGYEFGKQGEQFVRMNLACPKSTVKIALDRIKDSILKTL